MQHPSTLKTKCSRIIKKAVLEALRYNSEAIGHQKAHRREARAVYKAGIQKHTGRKQGQHTRQTPKSTQTGSKGRTQGKHTKAHRQEARETSKSTQARGKQVRRGSEAIRPAGGGGWGGISQPTQLAVTSRPNRFSLPRFKFISFLARKKKKKIDVLISQSKLSLQIYITHSTQAD